MSTISPMSSIFPTTTRAVKSQANLIVICPYIILSTQQHVSASSLGGLNASNHKTSLTVNRRRTLLTIHVLICFVCWWLHPLFHKRSIFILLTVQIAKQIWRKEMKLCYKISRLFLFFNNSGKLFWQKIVNHASYHFRCLSSTYEVTDTRDPP